jgi:cell division protein FtsI (penicillin-binding protein 3)
MRRRLVEQRVQASRSPRRVAVAPVDPGRSRAAANRAVARAARPDQVKRISSNPVRTSAGATAKAPSASRHAGPSRATPRDRRDHRDHRGHEAARVRRPPPRRPARPSPPVFDLRQIDVATLLRGVFRLGAHVIALVGAFFSNTAPRARLQPIPEKVTRARTGRRLVSTGVMLSVLFILVVWKLVDLQVLNANTYVAFGESQRVRTELLAADRGAILDRNGVALALSTPQRSVFVDPKLVEDAPVESKLLAELLGLDAAEIEKKMTAPNRFSYIARQLPDEVIDKVKALKEWKDPADPKAKPIDRLKGVAFVEEPKRFTPSDALARSLIGQVNIDGEGIGGLEKMYGEDLTGTPGQLVLERDPEGRTIAATEPKLIPAVKGKDVQLTIDRSMQFETERILGEQVKAAGAKSGVAIVMKPDTGEILSMANVVSDPKTGEVSIDGNNAALTTVYEPGSVMKIVTAAGAIEEGLVQPDTIIPIADQIQICDAMFSEHDGHGNVGWPVSRILSQSSNVGTIKLGQLLGKQRIYDYLRSFGFGERTSVNFPNEQAGGLMTPDKWWCSSQGSIPIGNGVSVTPLQMIGAYNTIANGGVYVAPKLVQATIDGDGSRHAQPTDPGRRVVSQDTANKVNLMLRGVVEEGTGTAASIAGYNPAGKTGTARKPQPGGGYIAADGATHYEASFVGFVPAEAPALSVFVLIDDPSKEGIYGGVVAAPAFAKIGEAALREFNVPPPASDIVAGGVKTDPTKSDPTKVATATGTDVTGENATVQRTADGRVRAPAAGTETTTTLPAGSTSGTGTGGTGGTTSTGAGTVPTTAPRSTTTTKTTVKTTTSTTQKKP